MGRIAETAWVAGWDLATSCGFPVDPNPVTVAPLTGELSTVGAPLICEPFEELVVSQAVPCAGLGVLGGLTKLWAYNNEKA